MEPNENVEKVENTEVNAAKPVVESATVENKSEKVINLSELTIAEREELAASEDTSEELLRQLSNDKEWRVKVALANNRKSPADVLAKFARDVNYDVRMGVAKNESAKGVTLVILAYDKNREIGVAAINNHSMPDYEIANLALNSDTEIRIRVAQKEEWEDNKRYISVLDALCNDENAEVRAWIAKNPALVDPRFLGPKPLHLEALSRDKDPFVREMAAGNIGATVKMLTRLSNDKNINVRKAAAGNKSITPKLFKKLSKDKSWEVRKALAGNPSAANNENILLDMVNDKDVNVRKEIAITTKNEKIIEKLVHDESPEVLRPLVRNPAVGSKYLDELANSEDREVLIGVASNINTRFDTLHRLYEREIGVDSTIRAWIAQNPSLSETTMWMISEEEGVGNRKHNLAINPSLPVDLQKKLANDKDDYVRERLLENPSVSMEIVSGLLSDSSDKIRKKAEEILDKHLSEIKKDDPLKVEKFLSEMLKSNNIEQYYYMAKSEFASDELLEKLLNGENGLLEKTNINENVNYSYVFKHSVFNVIMSRLKNLDENTLLKIVQQESEYNVLENVFENKNTTPKVLKEMAGIDGLHKDFQKRLAESPDIGVREALAGNVSIRGNEQVIEKLFNDPDLNVRKILEETAAKDAWLQETVDKLKAARKEQELINPDITQTVTEHNEPDLEHIVNIENLHSDWTKEELSLASLAYNPDWQVRKVAASNPKLPINLLRKLAADENEQVREVAGKFLKERDEKIQKIVNEFGKGVSKTPQTPTKQQSAPPSRSPESNTGDVVAESSPKYNVTESVSNSETPFDKRQYLKELLEVKNIADAKKFFESYTSKDFALHSYTYILKKGVTQSGRDFKNAADVMAYIDSISFNSSPDNREREFFNRQTLQKPEGMKGKLEVLKTNEMFYEFVKETYIGTVQNSIKQEENFKKVQVQEKALKEAQSDLANVKEFIKTNIPEWADKIELAAKESLKAAESIKTEPVSVTAPEVKEEIAPETKIETAKQAPVETEEVEQVKVQETIQQTAPKERSPEQNTVPEQTADVSIPEPSLHSHESPATEPTVEQKTIAAEKTETVSETKQELVTESAKSDKKAETQIGQIKVMMANALEAGTVPFQNKAEGGVTELPYNPENEIEFERSNNVAAALHMANIGSDDPRYVSEDAIKAKYELKEGAVPVPMVFKGKGNDGNYVEKTEAYYNAAQIEGFEPYKAPQPSVKADVVVEAKTCETPAEQLQENLVNWNVAVSEGKTFVPGKTQFGKEDFIGAVKNMNENQIAGLCYKGTEKANEILAQHRKEESMEHQQQVEIGKMKR